MSSSLTRVIRAVRLSRHATGVSLRTAAPVSVRSYSKFDERENAFENMDVQKHDAELLRKLADKARTNKGPGQAPPQSAPHQSAPHQSPPQESAAPRPTATAHSSAPSGYVSAAEFNEFRKDIVNRLRSLEEKVGKR